MGGRWLEWSGWLGTLRIYYLLLTNSTGPSGGYLSLLAVYVSLLAPKGQAPKGQANIGVL